MFPIPDLPNPYIILAAVAAVVIAWFAGDHHGYAKEHDKFVTFQGEVKAAGERAEAKTKAVADAKSKVKDAQKALRALTK